MTLHSPNQASQRAAERKRNPATHDDPELRQRIHVVCHTCATDDDAREAFGAEPYCHEVLTRNKVYAWRAWKAHKDAGHNVERLGVAG